MSAQPEKYDLLRDLEQRQDAVLAQLDELNDRIEHLLAEWAPVAQSVAIAGKIQPAAPPAAA
jgi:hypothetical protein